MSRSRKKYPAGQLQGSKKYGKRAANKKVRRSSFVSSGKKYKKLYDSWNIADYKWYCTKPEDSDFRK